MRGRGWRSAVVALALVVAVPGAPMARVFTVACKQCPPSCPMHRAAKPSCHRAPGAKPGAKASCHRAMAGLTAPCCSEHRLDPLAMTVAPAVMPAPVHSWPVFCETRVSRTPVVAPERTADPPDHPPPIVVA